MGCQAPQLALEFRLVKTLEYSVVVFPRLDTDQQLRRLVEKYDPSHYQTRPHMPIVTPFTPATLEEIQGISDYISQVRRKLHPLAVSFQHCVEAGNQLLLLADEGREKLLSLHQRLHGCEFLSLVDEAGFEPGLVLAVVPDPEERTSAIAEVNRVGRTLALIDSLTMARTDVEGRFRPLVDYPFGIGLVRYYERFPA